MNRRTASDSRWVLLSAVSIACSATNPVNTPATPRGAVDFFYFEGQVEGKLPIEILVPFAVGRSCRKVFLAPFWGLAIEGVKFDGRDLKPGRIDGHLDDFDDWAVDAPGPGFAYQRRLTDLMSADDHREHYTGWSFYVSDKSPLPKSIEIRYRVRCAETEGKMSEPMVTRGVLFAPPATQGGTKR